MARAKTRESDMMFKDESFVAGGKRSAYVPHRRYPAPIVGESMARQDFAEECDINVLMSKYQKTGLLPSLNRGSPMYGDYSDVPDYMTALNTVRDANEAFAALPATVRRRFENDPAQFVAFATDSANADELVKMGLATKRAAPAAAEDEVPAAPAPPKVVPPKGD